MQLTIGEVEALIQVNMQTKPCIVNCFSDTLLILFDDWITQTFAFINVSGEITFFD